MLYVQSAQNSYAQSEVALPTGNLYTNGNSKMKAEHFSVYKCAPAFIFAEGQKY